MRLRPSDHWPSFLVAALCLLIACLPAGGQEALLLKRKALQGAEYWRLWTGHWVHFGWKHLAWDLASFLLLGLWLDAKAGKGLGLLLLTTAAPLLSLGLLVAAPDLGTYGGLSGLVCAYVGALATWYWKQKHPVLAAVMAIALSVKISAELLAGQSLLGTFSSQEIRNCPEIHLLGVLLGPCLAHFFLRRKSAAA